MNLKYIWLRFILMVQSLVAGFLSAAELTKHVGQKLTQRDSEGFGRVSVSFG